MTTDNPLVVAVMLVNGRSEMVNRAVRSFHSQIYERKMLLVLDSGTDQVCIQPHSQIEIVRYPSPAPIGELRNIANIAASLEGADIIAHWDSDDWSHHRRLQEQVEMLKVSGADAVGYREMLFWDTTPGQFCGAWLFTSPNPNYCLGTSLCYWVKTWERRPFPHKNTAEDTEWCLRLKTASTSAAAGFSSRRMIASIHGSNTCSKIIPGAKEWTRVPQADNLCRETMKL